MIYGVSKKLYGTQKQNNNPNILLKTESHLFTIKNMSCLYTTKYLTLKTGRRCLCCRIERDIFGLYATKEPAPIPSLDRSLFSSNDGADVPGFQKAAFCPNMFNKP